jgi:glycosyltransferase involved in cell wall biosynthesis
VRILIDASQIPLERVGVGVYAYHLLRELVSERGPDEFHVVVQDDDLELLGLLRGKARVIAVRAGWFRRLPVRFVLEQLLIPVLAARRRVDLIHSLHYSFPLLAPGRRRVVTLHDMIFFRFPALHLSGKARYFRTFIRLASRLADGLLFVSHSSLDDFESLFPRSHAVRAVSPLACDSRFRPAEDADAGGDLERRYGLPERYVLFVGTLEPRKNLPRLLEAFQGVAARFPDVDLVVSGKQGWGVAPILEAVRRLGLAGRVHFTGYVAEADKPELYRRARVFAYPSLYEGFGIPVLEALASGVPVITSRVSSMPEVAGEAAVLIDPEDTGAIRNALAHLLDDEGARQRLRLLGPVRARLFDWRRTAEVTRSLYAAAAAA